MCNVCNPVTRRSSKSMHIKGLCTCHKTENPCVGGSIPPLATNIFKQEFDERLVASLSLDRNCAIPATCEWAGTSPFLDASPCPRP